MGKRKEKGIFQSPDDYLKSRFIEESRLGKEIIVKNSISEEEHKNYISSIAGKYPIVKDKINKLVEEIRILIVSYNPLDLLHHSYGNMFISMTGKLSEFQNSFEDIMLVRMIDYIQSVIASSEINESKYKELDIENWTFLYDKVCELYRSLSQYHLCYSAYLKQTDENFDENYNSLYIQAQELKTLVRGKRYPVHDTVHHLDLLSPHEEIFKTLYGISIKEFLSGVEKIQVSMMRGIENTMQNLEYLMEKTLPLLEKNIENNSDLKDSKTEMEMVLDELGLTELKNSFMGQFFGHDLFDVEKISGLPRNLLEDLAWKVGEAECFFSEGDLAGWPLRRLPIEERPFLWVDEKIYHFDLYSLSDNLYRIIQRLIIRKSPDYRTVWNEKQMQVSEQLPFRLFSKLLPKAETYNSIYYRGKTGKKGKKQWCECDGLLLFDDHLIVIEVKGGAFTYTHPSTDFNAFITSIEALAKKPYEQASRFIDILKEEGKITVCDEKHKPLKEVNIKEFRHITLCSVTIDNFNEFTARIDKLSSIGIELGEFPSWNISIDDLRVYADYFDSPSEFLHFLEQRLKASQSKEIEVIDELDHLGLYIEHNDYVKTAELIKGKQKIWQGYREELDNYFATLTFPDMEKLRKPQQNIPKKIQEIIDVLDQQRKTKFTKVAGTLLDFNDNARLEIENTINILMRRQQEENKVMPLSTFGDSNITFICNQDNIKEFKAERARNYVLATMLKSKDDNRLAVYLDYNVNGDLYNVEFSFLTESDIPSEKYLEIQLLAEEYAGQRVLSYKKQNGIDKIGRNQQCPCGSGKKYKRCCGD